MAYLTSKRFDFRSSALPEYTFGVVDFKGFEGFSKPYEFEIMLVSSDPEIDLTEVLQNPAVFSILREEGDIPFNGILAQFEQLHAVVDHVFYRAVLVPRFWWLSLTHHNQVFLDKTVPEIIGEVLEDGGLTTDDYELRISNDYPKWEYICQYRESHQNFVSRWMEREGMYYFFEQTEKGEKLIITDSNMSHTPMSEGKTMYYSPPSALEEAHREEVINAIVCKQKLLPAKLHLNDYNYRKPSLSLSAEAEVLDRGRGDVHVYGEHFRTPEEGQELARIRAEALLCREKCFHGESTIPFLRPGYLFELQNHYRESFNQQYLTIELEHEGSQVGYLLAGIQEGLSKVEEQPYYRNSFVTIPSEMQYRHPKTTEKPTFNGTINARIDAEGTGEYAELDDQGRYKVRLPFDVSGRNDGRASHWLRMAQPYGGENQCMHFPLHKHTEVLLTFVEGNPDRPIIAAAVPNPESPSLISSANQSRSIIKTGRGPQTGSAGAAWRKEAKRFFNNYIEFDDQAGAEGIRIHSPGDLWLEAKGRYADYRVGAPSVAETPTDLQYLNNKFYDDAGDFRPTGMLPRDYNYGISTTPDYGHLDIWYNTTYTDPNLEWTDLVDQGQVKMTKGDTFITQEGNVYDFRGYWVYSLGNSYVENHMDQKAVLNTKKKLNDINKKGDTTTEPDMLDKGGPDWTIINWPPEESTLSGDWDNGKVWVDKKFGNSYDYIEGSSINSRVGSTLDIKYGGKHVEWLYRSDGSKKSYTMRGGTVNAKEEKNWMSDGTEVYHKMVDKDYNTTEIVTHPTKGLASYDYTTWPPWFNFNAWACYIPKVKISTCACTNETTIAAKAGSTVDIKTNAALACSINTNASAAINLNSNIGLKFEYSKNIAASISITDSKSLPIKIQSGVSIGIDIDKRVGGNLVLHADKGLDFKTLGLSAIVEADIKAKKAAKVALEKKEVNIGSVTLDFSSVKGIKIT